MENLVDFFTVAEKLECEYRIIRMSDDALQSVASHSWNMAMMAIAVQPYLKNDVDMAKVLKMCVLHDLPEAISHDIPLHQQSDDCLTNKKMQEACAISKIEGMLNNSDVSSCFEEYEKRMSSESKLVKALDRLDTTVQYLCAKDLSYICKYNDNFYWKLFFSEDFAKSFDFEPVLRKLFEEIKNRVTFRLKNELNIDADSFKG